MTKEKTHQEKCERIFKDLTEKLKIIDWKLAHHGCGYYYIVNHIDVTTNMRLKGTEIMYDRPDKYTNKDTCMLINFNLDGCAEIRNIGDGTIAIGDKQNFILLMNHDKKPYSIKTM